MAQRLRRLFVALSLLAFLATGLVPAMAMGEGAPTKAMAMSTGSDDPMPCCPEKAVSCMTDACCVFLVGLPMPHPTASTALGGALLSYDFAHDRGEGLSIQPALGPPILFA